MDDKQFLTPWLVDDFSSPTLDANRWVGGYSNLNNESVIRIGQGVHIAMQKGTLYSGGGIVTRQPVCGDFDAVVQFSATHPQPGTTLELAAITIDPPRGTRIDRTKLLEPRDVSLVFDVHGAPPYVSSECDEADGFRMSWNRSYTVTRYNNDNPSKPVAQSDNHYNRYGEDVGNKATGAVAGWLRLVRNGSEFSSYFKYAEGDSWQCSGTQSNTNFGAQLFLRFAAKHWSKKGAPAPENIVSFKRVSVCVP